MDESQMIAKAYYNTATEQNKALGEKFFNGMDQDGDRQITIQEFLAYMKSEGHTVLLANPQFFEALNKNGSGKLDFLEVTTLFYIIESGRKHCDGWGEFLKGMFFSCIDCFDHNDTSYNLCYPCFCDGKYVHDHVQFLDNYVLLETGRVVALKEKKAARKRQREAERKKAAMNDVASCIYSLH